ncbi:MAG: hypothetical protein Q8N99_07465 [Nanoarchaeota archaeon]|nr:hypothetical protein [Nanoarchaeota archaeon]
MGKFEERLPIQERTLSRAKEHYNQKNNPPTPKGFLPQQKIACWRVWFDWSLFLGCARKLSEVFGATKFSEKF